MIEVLYDPATGVEEWFNNSQVKDMIPHYRDCAQWPRREVLCKYCQAPVAWITDEKGKHELLDGKYRGLAHSYFCTRGKASGKAAKRKEKPPNPNKTLDVFFGEKQ